MRYLLFCVQCFRRLDWVYFNSALWKGFKILVAAEQFVQMNIPIKKELVTVQNYALFCAIINFSKNSSKIFWPVTCENSRHSSLPARVARVSRETPLGPGAKKDGCFRRLFGRGYCPIKNHRVPQITHAPLGYVNLTLRNSVIIRVSVGLWR